MIWIAILAQLAAPIPLGTGFSFTVNDVPEGAYDSDRPTVVRYGLSIAPDGTAYDCRIEVGSGNAELDRQTCNIVLRDARFRPATDSSGNPTYGVYRDDARWWFGEGRSPHVVSLDGEFTVNKLPGGVQSPAVLKLALAVDPSGQPSDCVAAANESRAALASVACKQLLDGYRTVPQKSVTGGAIASVQNATVAFRTN